MCPNFSSACYLMITCKEIVSSRVQVLQPDHRVLDPSRPQRDTEVESSMPPDQTLCADETCTVSTSQRKKRIQQRNVSCHRIRQLSLRSEKKMTERGTRFSSKRRPERLRSGQVARRRLCRRHASQKEMGRHNVCTKCSDRDPQARRSKFGDCPRNQAQKKTEHVNRRQTVEDLRLCE